MVVGDVQIKAEAVKLLTPHGNKMGVQVRVCCSGRGGGELVYVGTRRVGGKGGRVWLLRRLCVLGVGVARGVVGYEDSSEAGEGRGRVGGVS
mgnify:CR=1 FL=1